MSTEKERRRGLLEGLIVTLSAGSLLAYLLFSYGIRNHVLLLYESLNKLLALLGAA